MPEHTTDDGQDRTANAADAVDRPDLVAELVLSRNRPAACTIYPLAADALERTTAWITAEEGSFVAVEAME